MKIVPFFLLASTVLGCGGGQYGYARTYEPLGEERGYLGRAVDLPYEEIRRTRPEQQQLVGWFGIVLAPPEIAADGTARVELSLRAHQDRHLCSSDTADSCRVTVSEREIGRFTAILTVRPEDRAQSPLRLWTGSLLRVYGTATGEEDGNGGPVLRAEWYRHWPSHYYVTTASARSMRQ